MAEVQAGAFVGENMSDKDALIDFDAVLVALQPEAFGPYLLGRRREAGNLRCRLAQQIVEAHESAAILRQSVVNRDRMGGEKSLAMIARGKKDRFGRFSSALLRAGFSGRRRTRSSQRAQNCE